MFDMFQFPPPESSGEEGMVLAGGVLTPSSVVSAYLQGIFPWPLWHENEMLLTWWSPDPRGILEFDSFHGGRRLRQRIRADQFTVTCDQAFDEVIRGCAEPRKDDPFTWITVEMIEVYNQLHQLGHAHSVEVWQKGEVVGGVYGIGIGGFFAAESMFHRVTDASKVALAYLLCHLRQQGFTLLDIQEPTPHTLRLGAETMPRSRFLKRMRYAMARPVTFSEVITLTGKEVAATIR